MRLYSLGCLGNFFWTRLGLNDSLLLITSQSEPTVCSGWLIGSSVTKAQGWGGWLFVLCDGSRIGLFSPFLQAPFDKSSQIYKNTMQIQKTAAIFIHWMP